WRKRPPWTPKQDGRAATAGTLPPSFSLPTRHGVQILFNNLLRALQTVTKLEWHRDPDHRQLDGTP
ncbi:hypothetical protein, partial [Arthrobacter sp. Leaf141]|uniref:hypothetical protein n=1 Tax=Arthrobacter sp. Leaf141 TaxID=1736273 RepID=UPI001F1A6B57